MPSSSTPFEAEWSLLRIACSAIPSQDKTARIRELLLPTTRWSVVFDRAEEHGVQPLLAQALSQLEEHIPPEQLSTLRQSYQSNLRKALFLSREFIRILECLSAAEIEVMPYKGLVLAETLYGDIALRQSGDIDLLIHAKDLNRIREAVAALGYTPHSALSPAEEEAYLQSGYECAFDAAAGRNLLEVQWALQPRFYAVDLDIERLFERAVAVNVAGVNVKSLCSEDLYIVLALHAAKHVWGRLIWICDLARIGALPTLNWKSMAAQAQELGIVRILRVSLHLAQRLLDVPIPVAADATLPKDARAEQIAEQISNDVLNDKTPQIDSAAYFQLMMQLRERRMDRMRFRSRLLLTPGPGEWALVRLPRILFPLYRVVRLSRLAARLIARRN